MARRWEPPVSVLSSYLSRAGFSVLAAGLWTVEDDVDGAAPPASALFLPPPSPPWVMVEDREETLEKEDRQRRWSARNGTKAWGARAGGGRLGFLPRGGALLSDAVKEKNG